MTDKETLMLVGCIAYVSIMFYTRLAYDPAYTEQILNDRADQVYNFLVSICS